ncbi:MAG: ectoine synthase, partial [Alphaproteobacteria bacterium]
MGENRHLRRFASFETPQGVRIRSGLRRRPRRRANRVLRSRLNGIHVQGQRTMFVRTVDELRNAGGESVLGDGKARSARLLTKVDGMGFSLSDATLSAGAEVALWYKNHWEANYIV